MCLVFFRLGIHPQLELHAGRSHEKRPVSTSTSQHLDAYILLGIFLFVILPIVTNTDITGHEPSSKVVITS